MEINEIVNQLQKHPSKKYKQRPLSDIDTIVIHHTATRATTTIKAIARYHVAHKGWPGIAYHYCITASGEIFKTNTLTTISYHAYAHNEHTIGIVLIGDFTNAPPPQTQLMAAAELIAFLQDAFGDLPIMPHRHLSQTACPGNTWEQWLHELKTPVDDENWRQRAIAAEQKIEQIRSLIS